MSLPIRTLPAVAGPDPLALLEHLCAAPGEVALLHSATGAAFSVVGIEPLRTVEVGVDGAVAAGGGASSSAAPLTALEQAIAACTFSAPHPLVGWLGFISYDIGRTLEHIPGCAVDDLAWPLVRFTLFRHYLLFDHAQRQWTAAALDGEPLVLGALEAAARASGDDGGGVAAAMTGCTAPGDYRRKVQRIKEYIGAGDIYQANLAQRWSVRTAEAPQAIYRRLCGASPAHYAAFLRFTSADGRMRHVLSASPELFLDVGGGRAVTRPIKGTRRRDAEPVRDGALRDELMASAKDRAELTMIVDLLRNDLGRVSRYGSVRVLEPRALEEHPTVWHTVATIESELRRGEAGLAAVLAAACPGGSISGAPKIRAMQIIEALEGFRRGLYCGNIGVIGPNADTFTLNIAIRTILIQDGLAQVFAGGGIVADSDPQAEYEETLHKAAALFRALGLDPPASGAA